LFARQLSSPELVGGGGLKDINLQAQDEMKCFHFKRSNRFGTTPASPRRKSLGGQSFTDTSLSPIPAHHLTARKFSSGNGATILASANGAFTAGNVTSPPRRHRTQWVLASARHVPQLLSTPSIELGLDTRITGRDIRCRRQGHDNKTALINTDFNPANPPDWSNRLLTANSSNSPACRRGLPNRGAAVLVHPGAQFVAAQDLFLDSDPCNAVTTKGKYLGITMAVSAPSAFVTWRTAHPHGARKLQAKATAETSSRKRSFRTAATWQTSPSPTASGSKSSRNSVPRDGHGGRTRRFGREHASLPISIAAGFTAARVRLRRRLLCSALFLLDLAIVAGK